jgi:hypothetical protein
MGAVQPAGDACMGLNEAGGAGGRLLARDHDVSRTLLEGAIGEGENPVGDGVVIRVFCDREYCRTREIRWEAGSPTTQG